MFGVLDICSIGCVFVELCSNEVGPTLSFTELAIWPLCLFDISGCFGI